MWGMWRPRLCQEQQARDVRGVSRSVVNGQLCRASVTVRALSRCGTCVCIHAHSGWERDAIVLSDECCARYLWMRKCKRVAQLARLPTSEHVGRALSGGVVGDFCARESSESSRDDVYIGLVNDRESGGGSPGDICAAQGGKTCVGTRKCLPHFASRTELSH